MVPSYGSPITTFGVIPEKGNTNKMASSIPGRKVSKEYLPRNLRYAMEVTRLANAEESRRGNSHFRYIISSPIHEAVDPHLIVQVLDSVDGSLLLVSELLDRLPVTLQRRVFSS